MAVGVALGVGVGVRVGLADVAVAIALGGDVVSESSLIEIATSKETPHTIPIAH